MGQAEAQQSEIHDQHRTTDHGQRQKVQGLDERKQPDRVADRFPEWQVLQRLKIRKQHRSLYCGRQPASHLAVDPSCGESQSYQL